MTRVTITVPASRYADEDDCLTAAARDYIADHPALRGYDLDPSWVGGEDGEREEIALSVPDWSALADALAALRSAGWEPNERDDDAILSVDAGEPEGPDDDPSWPESDETLETIREIVQPFGCAADWTGDGNTGADGRSTFDIRIEAAS